MPLPPFQFIPAPQSCRAPQLPMCLAVMGTDPCDREVAAPGALLHVGPLSLSISAGSVPRVALCMTAVCALLPPDSHALRTYEAALG